MASKDDTEMYKLICRDRFDSIDQNLKDIEGHLTNHIPTEIKDNRKLFFKSMWGLAVAIITVLGGMVTALILMISK